MAKLAVNLVTWNGIKYIAQCLQSLEEQTLKDFTLLVIDNGSTDQTVRYIKEHYPQIKVVVNKNNAGFAKGHNQAIHWTKSEYVCCLNQDIVLKPDFFEKVINFMDQHPSVGSCSGKLYKFSSDNHQIIDSFGLRIFPWHQVIDYGSGEEDSNEFKDDREVFGVSGALPVYRRQALENVRIGQDFFDEDFFSYKEDVDLAYRLQLAGWDSYILAKATALHDRSVAAAESGKNSRALIKNRKAQSSFANYYSYRNHWYFLIKNTAHLKFSQKLPIYWFEFKKLLFIIFFEPKNIKVIKEVFKNKAKFKNKNKIIIKKAKRDFKDLQKWFN